MAGARESGPATRCPLTRALEVGNIDIDTLGMQPLWHYYKKAANMAFSLYCINPLIAFAHNESVKDLNQENRHLNKHILSIHPSTKSSEDL